MNIYSESLGQLINFQKSALYASKLIIRGRLVWIQGLSGWQIKKLPFKYLGLPIYKGSCRSQFFDEIIEKFTNRIEGWQSRFLSFGGKVTLQKAALSSLPIHVFLCMAIP